MRNEMLNQLLYISTSLDLESSEVNSILESCQRNNQERNVTGMLLYNGRNFLQLLEGAPADLKWIMNRITSDPRHSGISILEDISIEERACPDWLMRKIRLVDEVENRRKALDAELPNNLDPKLRRVMLNFASLN